MSNQRGRPRKTDDQAKRSYFNTRMRTELKGRLEAEAANAGRSLSEEIEHRLERSLLDDDAKFEDFGGKGGYELLRAFAMTARMIGEQRGRAEWWCDPRAYAVIRKLMPKILELLRPSGPIGLPTRAVLVTVRVEPDGEDPREHTAGFAL